jgi:hypothetical protein
MSDGAVRALRGVDAGHVAPGQLEDYATEETLRVVDASSSNSELGFEGMHSEATGRPAQHPSALLKISLYGYLNHV